MRVITWAPISEMYREKKRNYKCEEQQSKITDKFLATTQNKQTTVKQKQREAQISSVRQLKWGAGGKVRKRRTQAAGSQW